jgi:hypothetical protein
MKLHKKSLSQRRGKWGYGEIGAGRMETKYFSLLLRILFVEN